MPEGAAQGRIEEGNANRHENMRYWEYDARDLLVDLDGSYVGGADDGNSASSGSGGDDYGDDFGGSGAAFGLGTREGDGRLKVLRNGYLAINVEERRRAPAEAETSVEAGVGGGNPEESLAETIAVEAGSYASDALAAGGKTFAWGAASGPPLPKDEKAVYQFWPTEKAGDRLTTEGKRASDVDAVLFGTTHQMGDKAIVFDGQEIESEESQKREVSAMAHIPILNKRLTSRDRVKGTRDAVDDERRKRLAVDHEEDALDRAKEILKEETVSYTHLTLPTN